MSDKDLIVICRGHGWDTKGKETPYIEEIKRKIKEVEFNEAVGRELEKQLIRCGFDVLYVAPSEKDTPLKTRTDLANNTIKNKFNRRADAYISIHFDALDGEFDGNDPEGHTVFYYPGSASGKKLAQCIDKYLDGGTKQQDRNIKEKDLHVLRESKMVAILSENGFMDNKREAMLMLDKNFILEVATEHAKGICEYFGKKYVEEVKPVAKPIKKTVVKKQVKLIIETNDVKAKELLTDYKKRGYKVSIQEV